MMYTIEALIKGDIDIGVYYQKACQRWKEILNKTKVHDIQALSDRLDFDQGWFEQNCGKRWCGQEIMVIVGIAQFYLTKVGFGQAEDEDDDADRRGKALAVAEAFKRSGCSLEVKSLARDVAEFYRLTSKASAYVPQSGGTPKEPPSPTTANVIANIFRSPQSRRNRKGVNLVQTHFPKTAEKIRSADSDYTALSIINGLLSRVEARKKLDENTKRCLQEWLIYSLCEDGFHSVTEDLEARGILPKGWRHCSLRSFSPKSRK